MKKAYINPTTDIVYLSIGNHLCIGSPDPTKSTEGLDDPITNGGDDPGSFSRRRGQWDDEEDEDW